MPRSAFRLTPVNLMSFRGRANLFCAVLLLAPVAVLAQEAWVAPPEAKQVKNPVTATGETLTDTAPIYEQNCVRCHGVTGAASGPLAQALPKAPANLTDFKILKANTDGELFWKITNGRDPMPSFAQLPSKDRWELVNYVRDLARRSRYRFLGVRHSR